ncbi:MAG: exodeoxyribonuclease large subunit [Actinomycetota bacterium]
MTVVMSSFEDVAVVGPDDVPTFSISELVDVINATLDDTFERGFWVWGEISGLSVKNRHTYFTLVEQDDSGSGKRAQLSVNLWAGDAMKLRPVLMKSGLELVNGVKVRIFGSLNFYGPFGRLSLIMRGIDPRFTLGEIALQRDELVRRLKESGDYDRNKEIELSPVPLRLGVVTSGSSAAWADFRNQIEASGFGFRLALDDVVVQGESAVEAVSRAIDSFGGRDDLDAVIVIRGGGSKTDLSTFDAEPIARSIARCSLPVLTGIGHEIDVSVADEVAFESHKTPTACAVALIDRVREFVDETETLWSTIAQVADSQLERNGTMLDRVSRDIVIHTRSAVDRAAERLSARVERIVRRVPQYFADRERELDNVATRVRLLDPRNVLARGWSITRTETGRVVRSASDVASGDVIVTVVSDGTFVSTIGEVRSESGSKSSSGDEPTHRDRES